MLTYIRPYAHVVSDNAEDEAVDDTDDEVVPDEADEASGR